MIGDNIEVVVLSVSGDQIKLGIVAPKTVSIYRKEIFEQIQNENLQAAQSTADISALSSLIQKK